MEAVIECLASGEKLDESYHDHSLSGNWVGFRECHIAPDWLLIYQIDGKELILFLTRTGTHGSWHLPGILPYQIAGCPQASDLHPLGGAGYPRRDEVARPSGYAP